MMSRQRREMRGERLRWQWPEGGGGGDVEGRSPVDMMEDDEEGAERVEEEQDELVEQRSKFFACYLLGSSHPERRDYTYVGFTVRPDRRIRQHNGELTMGAHRTKRWRPWEMLMFVCGFPSKISALQFEWAWQNPKKSRHVWEVAKQLTGVGAAYKIHAKVRERKPHLT